MFGRKHRKESDISVDSREDDRPWKLNFHIGFEDGDARSGKTTEVAKLQSNIELPSYDEIVNVSTSAFTWTLDKAVYLSDRVAAMRSTPRMEVTPNN